MAISHARNTCRASHLHNISPILLLILSTITVEIQKTFYPVGLSFFFLFFSIQGPHWFDHHHYYHCYY